MPTQNVNLTDQQSAFIRECVAQGEFQNASEVVRAGLRLLKLQVDEHAAKIEALKAEIQIGLDDIAAGRYTSINSEADLDALFDEIKRNGRKKLFNRSECSD